MSPTPTMMTSEKKKKKKKKDGGGSVWEPGRYEEGDTSTKDMRGIMIEHGLGKRKRREERDEDAAARAEESARGADYASFFQGRKTHGAALKSGDVELANAAAVASGASMQSGEQQSYGEDARASKRGRSGKVSGRDWKRSDGRNSRAQMKATNTGRRTTFEARMEAKRAKQAFREAKDAAREQDREERRVQREKRAEKERIKEENRRRTGELLQVISNPATVKKMMKSRKQKKLLRTV